MNEWWLVGGLVGLGISGLVGLLQPLQLTLKRVILLVVTLVLLLCIAYSRWGNYYEWHQFVQFQRNQNQVKSLLATAEGRAELIGQLRTRLTQTPESAYGWMLLGKLYLTQGDEKLAREAFAFAKKLKPKVSPQHVILKAA
jgi:cytochrome c-type biogenesis protein CcmH/NrfG